MHYTIKTGTASQLATDCLILPLWENGTLTGAALELDQTSGGVLTHWLKEGDFAGKIGQTLLLRQLPGVASPRVLLLGCGNPDKFTPTQFSTVVSTGINAAKSLGVSSCSAYFLEFPLKSTDWQLYQAILLAEQGVYRFDRFKSIKEPELKLQTINFASSAEVKDSGAIIAKAQAVARAIKRTKDLGNLPSNICTPTFLAEEALSVAAEQPALKVEILEKEQLAQLGMHAFLAVAQGSQEPPKFIVIRYQGSQDKPIAFVGKGITFDSGGISIKPGAGMDEMRYDMCGAATVLGVMSAAAELKLPLNLVGVMACTENMPSGTAYKPGDIITTLSGQTIEILNTDAEGRVILSDALTYVERFEPETVIDIATLTGAIIIALGDKASGLFTTDDELAKELRHAGENSWDRAWQMPLWEEYQEQIKSPFADMANIGSEGGKSITAACLLSRFTKSYRWAHIDIAGTAWQSGKNKTATGRPVPMLMEFLFNRCR